MERGQSADGVYVAVVAVAGAAASAAAAAKYGDRAETVSGASGEVAEASGLEKAMEALGMTQILLPRQPYRQMGGYRNTARSPVKRQSNFLLRPFGVRWAYQKACPNLLLGP